MLIDLRCGVPKSVFARNSNLLIDYNKSLLFESLPIFHWKWALKSIRTQLNNKKKIFFCTITELNEKNSISMKLNFQLNEWILLFDIILDAFVGFNSCVECQFIITYYFVKRFLQYFEKNKSNDSKREKCQNFWRKRAVLWQITAFFFY